MAKWDFRLLVTAEACAAVPSTRDSGCEHLQCLVGGGDMAETKVTWMASPGRNLSVRSIVFFHDSKITPHAVELCKILKAKRLWGLRFTHLRLRLPILSNRNRWKWFRSFQYFRSFQFFISSYLPKSGFKPFRVVNLLCPYMTSYINMGQRIGH